MKLRSLLVKDIEGMLEWMHDSAVNQWFCFDAAAMTYDKAYRFIEEANQKEAVSRHFAIVNDKDEYLGTISLKNIDIQAGTAEYAISLRKQAQGMGVGAQATKQLLETAFVDMKLNRVYLNVLSDNEKAIRLYEKCGFRYEGEFREHIYIRGQRRSLKWYAILKDEFML